MRVYSGITFFCLLTAACQLKTPLGLVDAQSSAAFTSFSLNGTEGIISGDTINFTFKWTQVTSLVATYTTNARKVLIGDILQTSGVTINDFTKAKTYTIITADGATRTYTVNVSAIYPFADTGQTTCYDASTNQTCGTVAGTFPRQDAHNVDVPAARSFTGPTPHASFSSDYTTKDNITGLTWKSCSEGQSGVTCATGSATLYTWTNASNAVTCGSNLNAANSGDGYAGIRNWRLPTAYELATLLNHSNIGPAAIENGNFPNTYGGAHWTASEDVTNSAKAWSVGFPVTGSGPFRQLKTNSYAVRCVAAGTTVYAPPLTDMGDGTVKDAANNLFWQKCSMGQNNDSTCSGTATIAIWGTALNYCANLSLAGKTWRLPNISELRSIVDNKTSAPAINSAYFPSTAGVYISSTTSPPSLNFSVDIASGDETPLGKAGPLNARCVASGP